MISLPDYTCPLCGNTEYSFFETMERNIVVRCGKCGKLWSVAPEDWQDAVSAQKEIMRRVRSEISQ